MKDKTGGVEYSAVEPGYFEKRVLRKHARAFHLWALGVGAVISGDFFGWNFGLGAGGFGGMLLATGIITVMYIGLCFSIAEMSPALPHTGGAYSFARSAMGPWGGFITGLAENMEYILTPAVIVVAISNYLSAVLSTAPKFEPLWWLLCYVVFVGLNIWGVAMSFRVSVLVTLLALLVLVVFYLSALPLFDLRERALNIPPEAGGTSWFPKGWGGVFGALPFAVWFYLGIEELPLAAEESHDPKRDVPKGIRLGLITLIVTAFLTLIISASIPPGAALLSKSNEPIFDGFKAIFGAGRAAQILAVMAVAGLLASFHTIIFAYGRQIYSLSRAGYIPRFLSLTHGERNTPHVALIAGAALGYAVTLVIWQLGQQSPVGAVLLNMAVFGAVISYVLQLVSFVMLRVRFPHIERPYRSPFGIGGAVVAMLIALITLVTLFVVDPVYRKVVIGAAIWFLAGVIYFAAYGRKRVVKAPEEEFALKAAQKAK
jgi:ethanolamine permease